MDSRLSRIADLELGFAHQVHHPKHIFFRERFGCGDQPALGLIGGFHQVQILRIARHVQIAQRFGERDEQLLHVVALQHQRVENAKHARGVMITDRIHDVEQGVLRNHVQGADQQLMCDVDAAERDHLVHQAQRVAKGAIRFGCDHMERLVVDGDAFLFADVAQSLDDLAHFNAAEIETLAA